MPRDFDIKGALAAGYTGEEIADYLRSINLQPRSALAAPVARMAPADAEAAFQSAKQSSTPDYKFGDYQPAGPESGRFKLRVPRRDAGPTQAEEQYRGVQGLIREYSPASAGLVGLAGQIAGHVMNDPGLQYLPGPQAVELAGQRLLWRPGMRLAEIPEGGLKAFVPKGAKLEVADVQRYLDDAVRRTLGEIPDSAPAQTKMRRLLNLGRREFADQLTQPYSGIDWYGPDNALADELLRPVYPELEDDAKDTLQKAMSSAMSNNSNPREEAFNGARIWSPYQQTGEFPLTQPNGRFWPAQGVTHQILKLNRMVKELGERGASDFLRSDVTGRDIKYFVPNAKEIRLNDIYPGSQALGPKIGVYFRDVMGLPNDGSVVDVWMMRQNRRRLGGLLDAAGNAIEAPRTEGERRLFQDVDRRLAAENGVEPRDGQSVGWHYEQELYRRLGIPTKSYRRSDGIRKFLDTRLP